MQGAMRFARFTNAGLRAFKAAVLIGLLFAAMAGRDINAAAGTGSEAGPGQRTRGSAYQPGTQLSEEILEAQFEATVYEVQATSERLGSLDAKALTGHA